MSRRDGWARGGEVGRERAEAGSGPVYPQAPGGDTPPPISDPYSNTRVVVCLDVFVLGGRGGFF